MAGRPEKYTISYFPHYTKDSKTIYILENKYGSEGYAFWYKLLELLCNSKNLYYECRENGSMEYLAAKTGVKPDKAAEILNTLASLNSIDSQLWKSQVVWSDNLANNVIDVFKRRKSPIPTRPDHLINANINSINDNINGINAISANINGISVPQTKLNKIKLNKEVLSKDNTLRKPAKKYPGKYDEIYKKVVHIFNELCPSISSVDIITGKRKHAIYKLWTKFGDYKYFEGVFAKVEASPYLSGRSGKWLHCSFDWIINYDNFVKIGEGVYDN